VWDVGSDRISSRLRHSVELRRFPRREDQIYEGRAIALANSITTINPKAMQVAAELAAKFAQSGFVGPLHGIPIIVKDILNGIIYTMKTTIDSAGRLVIPKEIRVKANITPDTPLNVEWNDGRIEIEPLPTAVRFARKRGLLVAEPEHDVPVLRREIVEETRKRIRRERQS
jgi:AbrB family looped-hinge helix DNA binding protein